MSGSNHEPPAGDLNFWDRVSVSRPHCLDHKWKLISSQATCVALTMQKKQQKQHELDAFFAERFVQSLQIGLKEEKKHICDLAAGD